jgi:serine-type D-Ala-D-Ala carboxypeptidase/endopeptidase
MRSLCSAFAFALVMLAAGPAGAAPAAPPAGPEIQALLDKRVANAPGTGIVVGVIDGGTTTIYKAGTTGNAEPLDEHTQFEIGSVTKTFTATLLASMVLDHSVALADPVQKYVPATVRVPSRNGKRITLLQLATQHSGLPVLPSNMHPKDAQDPYADYTLAQLYAFLSGYTLTRDPGASFEYSNLGVGLLGDVLAARMRMPYAKLLRARVLAPLGMNETALVEPGVAQPARLALAHNPDGDVVKAWSFAAVAPAGALRSSVADMLRYVRCNLGQGPLAQTCLFAQQPRDTFPGNRIGLVWWTGAVVPVIHHGGDTYGFHASVAVSPDHRRGVVVLANGGSSVDDLAIHLIDASVPLAQVTGRAEITLDAQQLDEYAGTYAGEGMQYTVKRDGDKLMAQLASQPFVRVYPTSKDHFFYKIVDAQIDFTRDTSGKVNAIVLHQNGQRVVFVKPGMAAPTVAPTAAPSFPPVVPLDAATLDAYAGTYLAGAGLAFTVTRSGEQLMVQLTGQPAFPVYASAKDRFYYKVVDAQIDFERDASGKVKDLVLHQNGANLTAVKQ